MVAETTPDGGGDVVVTTATANPVLDQALELLQLGYWPVAIYAAGETIADRVMKGKEPIGKAWGASRWDEVRLKQTLANHPGRGIGICFGPGRAPNGDWLVDLEGDTDRARASLAIVLGSDDDPLTPAWDSRRGSHTIFVTTEAGGLRLLDLLGRAGATESKEVGKAGVWHLDELPGLEWRIGGYKPDGAVKQVQSVVPPTVGEDGIPRAWRTPPDVPVAELPDSVFEVLTALVELKEERAAIQAETEAESGQAGGAGFPVSITPNGAADKRPDVLASYVKSAIERECRAVESAPEGSRNNTLNRAAHSLGTLISADALDRLTAEQFLTESAKRAGLVNGEIGATIRSGLDAGITKPRDLSGVGTKVSKPSAIGNGHAPSSNGTGHSIDADLAYYPQTDTGNGERMVARFGRNLRHCHPWKKWLHWDGRRWAVDDTAAVRRMAKATARKILAEASTIEDEEPRERLAKWARATESQKLINSMMSCASAEEGIPVVPKELDQNAWLLNAQNGTIDLKTGELRPHRREDLLTCLAPVEFGKDASCPLWDATLERFFAGDRELIAFWDRLCGIALTGDVSEQILPILYGVGDNGKSTMTGALLGILGPDYGTVAPPGLLMVKRADTHSTERAYLFGKRLVVNMESAEDARLNEELVKQLTGSDPITARRMREDNWTFLPTHKLWLCTNHKPVIKGTDHAIWRRPKLVPFSVKIPDREKIMDFPTRLKAEYPGILARCVRGCLDWQKNGLRVPQIVIDATKGYRDEQDHLADFIDAECSVIESLEAKAGALYQRYCEFTGGLGEESISSKAFGLALVERGFTKIKSSSISYQGIGLKPKSASI